jgi:hypothetical protein
VTKIAVTNESVFYSADSTIALNKMAEFGFGDITEYYRVANYNRVLTQDEVNTIYDQIVQADETPIEEPIVYIPPFDPNLLFDVNFDESSLDVDYSKDGSALVFEANNPANITADDGFVTINPANHIKLTQGLPAYIKHTGDQSWVVNFRADATGNTRFLVHTAPPGGTRETTFEIRTGIFIFLYNNFFQVTLFKGPAETLVNMQELIGNLDKGVNIQSAVFTYRRADHKLIIYFNGVFIKEVTAPAGNEANVIDWSTADNLYVNQSHRFTPNQPTHYHKISAYDKILTPEEIVDIVDAAGGHYHPAAQRGVFRHRPPFPGSQ